MADQDQSRNRTSRQDDAEDPLRDAPPGGSTLGSSPPTRGPADNPARRASRDVGDVLADEVREGRWRTEQEERDDRRAED